MACETPVVASAVGGIKEVVIPGETGLLVPFEAASRMNFEPRDPAQFVHDLAAGVNQLLDDPERLRKMGLQSRERVERHFSWSSIATAHARFLRGTAEYLVDRHRTRNEPAGEVPAFSSLLARSSHRSATSQARNSTVPGPVNSIIGADPSRGPRAAPTASGANGASSVVSTSSHAGTLGGRKADRSSAAVPAPRSRETTQSDGPDGPSRRRASESASRATASKLPGSDERARAPPGEAEEGLIEPQRSGMGFPLAFRPVELAGEKGLLGLAIGILSSPAGSTNAA